MFEMRATIVIIGFVLMASIPYIKGEIKDPVSIEVAPQKAQPQLTAIEYIDRMGPNISAWKKSKLTKEASAESR